MCVFFLLVVLDPLLHDGAGSARTGGQDCVLVKVEYLVFGIYYLYVCMYIHSKDSAVADKKVARAVRFSSGR